MIRREPEYFSGVISGFLYSVGWKESGTSKGLIGISEGVRIESYCGPNGETDPSIKASRVLAEYLTDNDIKGASVHLSKPGTLPSNTVEILIGPAAEPLE